jgi:antirestriction protein
MPTRTQAPEINMKNNNTPSVYVGTYGKYNSGSIAGKWLDIADYADKDEFLTVCQDLHGPGDHEYMFQDYENCPEGMISEGHIDEDLFAYAALDDDDKERLEGFLESFGSCGTFEENLEKSEESGQGKHDSFEDWAREFFEEVSEIPDHLASYIDWERVASDMAYDYTQAENGWIYSNNW